MPSLIGQLLHSWVRTQSVQSIFGLGTLFLKVKVPVCRQLKEIKVFLKMGETCVHSDSLYVLHRVARGGS